MPVPFLILTVPGGDPPRKIDQTDSGDDMLNTMQSRFTVGPRRWLVVPVLGVAAAAALALLAVNADGLPLGLGIPAAATRTCPANHTAPCPHAPRVQLPIMHVTQPGPLGALPKVTARQPASQLTPVQQARQSTLRTELRAFFGTSTKVTYPTKPKTG
jgi:hypothetical protein